MTSKANPIGRALSLVIFALGALSLLVSLYLSHAAKNFSVDSIYLTPNLEGFRPVLTCRVKGNNPLPVGLHLRHLHMEVGKASLPTALSFDKALDETLDSGAFTLETQLDSGGRSLSLMAGQGLSLLVGEPLDYHATLKLGWAGLERTVHIDGTLSRGL